MNAATVFGACSSSQRATNLSPDGDDLEHGQNLPHGLISSAIAITPAADTTNTGQTFRPRWRRLK